MGNLIKNFKVLFFNQVFLVVLMSVVYWLYLFFTVSPVIVYDSIGYVDLAKKFYQGGFVEYLTAGPNSEPFYPFFISISMQIAEVFSISYESVLIFMQVGVLFATQILLFVLLKRMEINKWIIWATVFYMGISPAIVNMAFSIYSEIVTYPVILGVVLFGSYCWKKFGKSNYLESAAQGLLLALILLVITLIKGIYEYIFLFIFLIFCVRLGMGFRVKEKKNYFIGGLIFVLVFGGVFQQGVSYYKFLNQKYNGVYALTDGRGLFSLYSSAFRRTEDMSKRRVLAGIVHTMGEGACVGVFGEEECYFWGIHHYDSYGVPKLRQVRKEHKKEDVAKVMMQLSKEKIFSKPLPFTFWMGMEWLRMLFWESTQVGFVTYPDGLTMIFSHKLFKNMLRLGVSAVTILSFFYAVFFIIKNLKFIFYFSREENQEPIQVVFFMVFVICCHIGMYAIFMTITRFALPIAPLYLAIIAFALDRIFCKRKVIT